MKVEHIHTLDHTPGFKGHLFKLPEGIKSDTLHYLTKNVPVITTGRVKATHEGVAAVDLFAERMGQLLRSFGIDVGYFVVPDEEIVVSSVENLLAKYTAA